MKKLVYGTEFTKNNLDRGRKRERDRETYRGRKRDKERDRE